MLPETPQSFMRILSNAVRAYFPVLKKTFLIIVLITLVFNIYISFLLLPRYVVIHDVVNIVVALVLIFLWAMMLQLTDARLRRQAWSLTAAFNNCFKRLFSIYLSILYYAILILVILALANLLVWFTKKLWGHDLAVDALIFIFLIGAPLLYVLVLTYFAFPLVVLRGKDQGNEQALRELGIKKSIKKSLLMVSSAFREAVLITGKQWLQAFGVYVFSVFILMLIWPHTAIGQFMQRRYLTLAYDFIVLLLLLPIQASLIIFVLHDLQLRWQKQQITPPSSE